MALITATLFSGMEAQTETPPNIVLFFVDDLGWSDVGCYGSAFYDTPNIDALAKVGVRFTDAYATCHVCSPSRASLLTGKYPARLDLTDWLPGRGEFPFQRFLSADIHQWLPQDEVTLAEALKAHGYSTAILGKWHLGDEPNGPLTQGFDRHTPEGWNKGWPKAGYHAPFKFDDVNETEGDYLTNRLADEAVDYIESNKDKPFFLYLSHFSVHDPIQGRTDLVEKYENKLARIDASNEPPYILEGNPDGEYSYTRDERELLMEHPDFEEYKVLPRQFVKIKQHQDNPEFAAMVESVDESLGRVRAKLTELGIADNTIVIFYSDNGGMSGANLGNPKRVVRPGQLTRAFSTSNLPLRGAKGWLYEGGIRVPLIVHSPKHANGGTVSAEPITGTDMYPTILELAGLPMLPEQHMDGVSIVPLLSGDESLDRDAIYWHFPHYSNHGMQSPGGAIRVGDYKLLEYFENDTVQLFNLRDDLGEKNDLALKEPERTAELRAKLHTWRREVSANMMPPNPDYAP
jgi:arylsulfatase A-like enzyme